MKKRESYGYDNLIKCILNGLEITKATKNVEKLKHLTLYVKV